MKSLQIRIILIYTDHMKHSSQSNPCKHVGLAHSNVGEVSICPDCGVVHVALQYFSMRFDLEAFRALAHMLGTAQARIERSKQTSLPSGENHELMHSDGLPTGLVH